MNFIKKTAPNLGWLETKLSPEAMNKLWEYERVGRENNKDVRDQLAGNISTSLDLIDTDDWFFENIVYPQVVEYPKIFGIEPSVTEHNKGLPNLSTLWVNYQYKHEFNPQHTHSGVYSFVIWMKIPTHWKHQHSLPFVKNSANKLAGDFYFRYSSILGHSHSATIRMEPDLEGTMLFFPAQLQHGVYPFYESDEVRISISGNVSEDIGFFWGTPRPEFQEIYKKRFPDSQNFE